MKILLLLIRILMLFDFTTFVSEKCDSKTNESRKKKEDRRSVVKIRHRSSHRLVERNRTYC